MDALIRLCTAVAQLSAVDSPSHMLTRLNLETEAFHALADEGWRRLLTPDVTTASYIDQLIRIYGFEGPLEAALAYTPNLDLVIPVHDRYRAGYIAQDLIALGMRPGEVARLPQQTIAPFAGPLEALGWMYVVERATLLHEVVRRHLDARLPQARAACVFLSSSEGQVAQRRHAFGQALDRAARSERIENEIVAGALVGFRTWLEWSHRAEIKRSG